MGKSGVPGEYDVELNHQLDTLPEHIKTVLDVFPFPAVITDPAGRLLYMNEPGRELLAARCDFETGENLAGIRAFAPDGSPFPPEKMPVNCSLRSGQAVRSVEMAIELGDTRYPVNVSSVPLRDCHGVIVGAVAVFDDKRTEDDLKSANTRLGEVPDSISETFYAVDSQWRITYTSHKAQEWWHRPDGELLGRVLWDIIPEPEKTAAWKMHHEAMETRRPVHWETFSPSLKTWVRAGAYPSTDGGLAVYFRDVTKRRKAMDTLSFQADILQSVHDAIIATDENYLITYWNGMAEKMFGWTAEEAIGRHVKQLLQTRVPGSSREAVLTRMLRDNYFEGEVVYRRKDGSEIYTDVHAAVARNSGGKAVKIISSFRDITVQKSAAEELKESDRKALALVSELEEADRNKDRFIGVISHELRTPLATIVAGLSLIDITEDKEQVANAKEIIRRQTRQMCKLVDNLLELTRIAHDKIELKRETVNLNEIIRHAVSDAGRTFHEKNLKLCMKMPEEPVLLNADPVRITQCISNYLENAFKFTPKNGTIWISLKTEKENAVISIRDSGIGISPELLEQLFTPFIQADYSLAGGNSGLGLGLSIVKAIVERDGGTVTASSQGLGKGALFTMTLPVSGKSGAPAEGPAQKSSPDTRRADC